MGLIRNGIGFASNPGRYTGASAYGSERTHWTRASNLNALYVSAATVVSGASVANKNGWPSGYLPSACWNLPMKSGGMTSRKFIEGGGSLQGDVAGGVSIDAALDGEGEISTAAMTLLLYLSSSIVASGAVTSATLTGSVEAVASLIGQGDLAGAISAAVSATASLAGSGDVSGSISAALFAAASLAGSGDVVGSIAGLVQAAAALAGSATLSADVLAAGDLSSNLSGTGAVTADILALAHLLGDIVASGTVTATPFADGFMSANISATGGVLTADEVAARVWDRLLEQHTIPGSFGMNQAQLKKLIQAVLGSVS